MRNLKRHPGFEVAVTLTADTFIAPPRQSQRNWLLNRAIAEFADDLVALDRAAARFIAGTDTAGIGDRTATPLADDEIMEDWQVPIMRAMSALVTASHGDVLEIGFGRGIASGFVQDAGVRSHTIVECNASVIERYQRWRAERPGQDIRLIPGRWRNRISPAASRTGRPSAATPAASRSFRPASRSGCRVMTHLPRSPSVQQQR